MLTNSLDTIQDSDLCYMILNIAKLSSIQNTEAIAQTLQNIGELQGVLDILKNYQAPGSTERVDLIGYQVYLLLLIFKNGM